MTQENDMERDVIERLERMRQALDRARDETTRVVYCTECDDYVIGRDEDLPCDYYSDESSQDHREQHVYGDWEETSIYGYIQALEWVADRIDGVTNTSD